MQKYYVNYMFTKTFIYYAKNNKKIQNSNNNENLNKKNNQNKTPYHKIICL